MERSRPAPAALLYSHDTFGLGHLRRTLAVAEELGRRRPDVPQLLATGSPLAHGFRLPRGLDYLKLPSVKKVGPDRYASRELPLGPDEITALRSDLLEVTARHLRPELVVVDNVAGGLRGELVPALRALRENGARLVLGLRDIVDDAERVRRAWTRDGWYELLDDVFDRILVYGDEDVFDTAGEYGFSRAARAKTRYVGYFRRAHPPGTNGHSRRRRPFVLVTAGGGEDGETLVRTALDASTRARRDASWLLVTGPFLQASARKELVRGAASLPNARVVEFVDDLPKLVAVADAVVSMGGYNSLCEIVAAERPAVVVPRIEPRIEQLIRARVFEEHGLVCVLHPRELTPDTLASRVDELLEGGAPPRRELDLDGIERTGDELESLLSRVNGALAESR